MLGFETGTTATGMNTESRIIRTVTCKVSQLQEEVPKDSIPVQTWDSVDEAIGQRLSTCRARTMVTSLDDNSKTWQKGAVDFAHTGVKHAETHDIVASTTFLCLEIFECFRIQDSVVGMEYVHCV